jgi:iron(III) transport system permease protein
VTVPGARYGLISAIFVVFTLVITDFGVPKVIGGQFDVLATDIYKQVVAQQNFQMGAVVGLILLLPAMIVFPVDQVMQRRQAALLSSRAVPHTPKPDARIDRPMLLICTAIALAIVIMLAVAFFASIATFWPYNLTPSVKNYDFDMIDGGGWASYYNSVELGTLTALFGTAIVFSGAYLIE